MNLRQYAAQAAQQPQEPQKAEKTYTPLHREQEAIAADKTGDGFIYDMFYTELANHEYSYTGDVTDAVNACGLTVEQLNANPALIKGLKKAADDQRDE